MKDFERFKRKVLREHIIKSALVGLGIGLLAAALALVISFLTNPDAALVIGIIVGVSFAGAGGYYYWFKTKPTDKKIALRLDKKLGLHEKCATMIEFQEKEGLLLSKQREDATTTLAEKPTKALKFSVGIWVVPALAIASAFFTASFFTPKNANSQGDSLVDSSGFDWDGATSSIADNIKSEINNSDLNSALQSALNSVIEQLQSQLQGNSNVDERGSMVDDAKSQIDDIIDDFTSKEEIGKALKTEPDQHLKDQGQHLIDGNIQGLRQDFQDLFDYLSQLDGQDLRDYAGQLADQIDEALEKANAAGVSEDDPLYQTYKELANRLRSIEEMPTDPQPGDSGEQQSGNQNYDSKAKEMAESAAAEAASKAASNVNEQNENEQMASAIKSMMDSMVNPQPGSESSGSGEGSGAGQTEGSGEGSGSGAGQTEGSGSGSGSGQGSGQGSGSGSGSGQGSGQGSGEGSGSGQGSGEGSGQGSGQGSGSGEGSGAGQGQGGYDPTTDIIYTGDDTVQYGSVINSYNGGFADDNANGDDEDGDAADDYFNNLFGSDGKGGGK